MMLEDIVIDTNVLMHADNVSSGRDKEAFGLVQAMLASQTVLCLDVQSSRGEDDPRSSLIRQEYREHLDGLGGRFVAHMVDEGRVKYVAREVDKDVSRWINQRIPNKRDRTFVKVAINSIESVLASHDYSDFSASTRKDLSKRVQVDVLDAGEAAFRVDDGDRTEGG